MGNLPGLLAAVENWRITYVETPVGEVNRALGITGEGGDELPIACNHFMGLATCPSHLPNHGNVAALAVHSPKGVAGKRARGSLVPRHDHPGVQSPSQRHPNWLPTVEVAGQSTRKNVADFPMEILRW